MNGKVTFLGRTLEKNGMTYFDWTCSGFQFTFQAKRIEAELHAEYVEENGEIMTPFVAVFVDDMETPSKVIELKEGNHRYVLYDGEATVHKLRVLKRTEAQFGRTALFDVYAEGGTIEKWLPEETLRLEFIGDSITCGYGNEGTNPEDGFFPVQENGWMTYAARVARKLHAQFRMVSVSGIGVYSYWTDSEERNTRALMGQVYDKTDYYVSEEKWDFSKYRPDRIVICLGTNDFSYVQYNYEAYVVGFQQKYYELLKLVREKNGDDPYILCCFGIMGEGLNEATEEVVERFRKDTGDQKIRTLALKEQLLEDGFGSDYHPSMITHEKMAEKMAKALNDCR